MGIASTISNVSALTDTNPDGAITSPQCTRFREQFVANPAWRRAQNAVCKNAVNDVALDRQILTNCDFTFSHVLDDWAVTHQKKSGRCWLFAGLNLLRVGAMRRMNLKEFEFSQNYAFFWDKFERANYFLERIITTADRSLDDRHVAWLLSRPLDDGGQWDMFVSIVRKHGLVPKAVMPETESSSNSAMMNSILIHKLREAARTLREQAGLGLDLSSLRQTKEDCLNTIYRILSIHLGTPPDQFDWQWNDKDKAFHRDGSMTPMTFANKYVSVPLEQYVCLVHDPRSDSPVGRTFTIDCLGNVEGGQMVKYLNVDISLMKEVAAKVIVEGEPVWMGCDVGKMMQRELGLWDDHLYDYDGVYDSPFTLDKAQRLQYHQTQMTHAMLFTGVDMVEQDGAQFPRRWRVENSWGDDIGRNGFFLMNDNWFDQYMFEIAVRRTYLPSSLQQAIDRPPIVLPPWDPMGALASG